MKINLQKISRVFFAAGLLLFAGIGLTAQAGTITKNLQFQLTPTKLTFGSPPEIVPGTGSLTVAGSVTVGNSGCMRVEVTVLRVAMPSNVPPQQNVPPTSPVSTLKTQVFEVCGTENVSLSHNLSTSEDDARFFVIVKNIDPWNKITLNANLNFSYPDGTKTLKMNPNVPITLLQGGDEDRTFKLIPNTPGKVKIEVTWQGATNLRVRLFKPGSSTHLQQAQGSSPLVLEYDIKNADIQAGNEWKINVLNQGSPQASNIKFNITYFIQE